MPGESIVGGIIEIEFTDDHSATDVTWNVVGKTTDTVEVAPNTETANTRHHSSTQQAKAATTEAWEISFTADIVTGTAQLETMGVIDTNDYHLQGSVDSDHVDASNPAIQVTVYEDEAAKSSGSPKYQIATTDYLLQVESGELDVEDFSTRDFTIHSRERPIRLDAGGSLA